MTAIASGPPAAAAGPAAALEHVAVLAGGLSYERSVSLLSGSRVAEALRSQGLAVHEIEPDAGLLDRLREAAPDAVVVALHGQEGEDGSLRAVLDLLGTPYVGSDAAASRVAWDKPVAKHRLRTAGLATPDWVALPHSTFR